jgi:2-keto-myo-inositol isomerase
MSLPAFGLNGATTGTATIEVDIAAASAAGYQVLEVRDDKIEEYLAKPGHTLATLRGLIDAAHLKTVTVNALLDSTLPDADKAQAVLDRCKEMCEWATTLGAPYLVAIPSFMRDRQISDAEIRRRSIASLRLVAAVCKPYGIKVGFEFLGFPTCSVRTLGVCREIVDAVSDPNVGVIIDMCHFYTGGSTVAEMAGLNPAQLYIVHMDDTEPGDPTKLMDSDRLLPGDGVIPLREYIAGLARIGYNGAYSLELFRPEYWKLDPHVVARRGIEKMRALFAS